MDFIANHIGDIFCLAYYPVLFLIHKPLDEAMLIAYCEVMALGVDKD